MSLKLTKRLPTEGGGPPLAVGGECGSLKSDATKSIFRQNNYNTTIVVCKGTKLKFYILHKY